MMIKGKNMSSNDWNTMIRAVTDNKTPENCGFDMDDDAKKIFANMQAELKKMRDEAPGIPVGFTMVEKDWD